jgi:hypothetical protein
MSLPLGLVISVALAAPPVLDGPVASLSYHQMRAGQRFEIATGDQMVRGEFVDPATGECLAARSSGETFGPPQRLWLLGATQGHQPRAGGLQLILMHQVRVGMRMELGLGDLGPEHRVVTQPVTSIVLLRGPVASAQQTALR